jgi:hypothetical protein
MHVPSPTLLKSVLVCGDAGTTRSRMCVAGGARRERGCNGSLTILALVAAKFSSDFLTPLDRVEPQAAPASPMDYAAYKPAGDTALRHNLLYRAVGHTAATCVQYSVYVRAHLHVAHLTPPPASTLCSRDRYRRASGHRHTAPRGVASPSRPPACVRVQQAVRDLGAALGWYPAVH